MKSKNKRKLRKCNTGKPAINGWKPKDDIITIGETSDISNKPNTTGIGNSSVGAIAAGINAFAAPTLAKPRSSMTSGPIQYQKAERLSMEQAVADVKRSNAGNALSTIGSGASLGSAVGSVIPGVGNLIGGAAGAVAGAITGIFGAKSRKRKMKEMVTQQNKKIDEYNQYNLSSAHTNMLQEEYASENENTQDDKLYNKGKSKFTQGKQANALVGKGETIIDGNTGEMTEVQQGSGVGNDDVRAVVNPQDAIAGNLKNPLTGNTFAQDMKPLTRMESKLKRNNERNIGLIAKNTEKLVKSYTQPLAQSILATQSELHKGNRLKKYNFGKVAGEVIDGFIQHGTALAPSIYNIRKGQEQPDYIDASQLYSPNTRGQAALNTMYNRKYNDQSEIEQLRGLESRQRYNSRNLGSEGGLNRAMDIAGNIGTRRVISEVASKKQNVNNQYSAEAAQMAAQLGAQESQGRTNALYQAYDINARNKAANNKFTSAGIEGISQYSQLLRKNKNAKSMDDIRMQILKQLYSMGTTDSNYNKLFE